MNIFEDDDELKDPGLSDEERKAKAEDAGLDSTTNLQKDKIFNNNYESTEFDTSPIKFQMSSQYEGGSSGTNLEDNIEGKMAFEHISSVLDQSKYSSLNKPDADGNYKKLNKLQINEVYSYVVMTLPEFPRIHVFSTIQDYFDVNSNKFYDSLSNTFKKELIEELRELGNLREKTRGPLF
jgi:hypothetical protein